MRPIPCNLPGCLACTHTGGCEAGWIESKHIADNGRLYDAVTPCPRCRPERIATSEEIADGNPGRLRWLRRLRETNARTARSKSDDW